MFTPGTEHLHFENQEIPQTLLDKPHILKEYLKIIYNTYKKNGDLIFPFVLSVEDVSGMSNPVFITSLVGTD